MLWGWKVSSSGGSPSARDRAGNIAANHASAVKMLHFHLVHYYPVSARDIMDDLERITPECDYEGSFVGPWDNSIQVDIYPVDSSQL